LRFFNGHPKIISCFGSPRHAPGTVTKNFRYMCCVRFDRRRGATNEHSRQRSVTDLPAGRQGSNKATGQVWRSPAGCRLFRRCRRCSLLTDPGRVCSSLAPWQRRKILATHVSQILCQSTSDRLRQGCPDNPQPGMAAPPRAPNPRQDTTAHRARIMWASRWQRQRELSQLRMDGSVDLRMGWGRPRVLS